MRKRRRCLLAAVLVALTCSAPASAWFVLPYLVFDAQRFAQQALAIRNEVQLIDSLARHLENDVRMLRGLDYSNLGAWTTGLQRVESAVARIEALGNEPDRMDQHIEHNWPIDWSSDAAEHSQFESTRDAWLARERAALADCRAVQNGTVAEMPAVKSRVGDLVARSNSADGTTAVLQARTQLNGELSGELSKLEALRLSRAILRSERIAREQSETTRAAAVRDWLMRRDGTSPPAQGRGAYRVTPIPEQPMAQGGAR